MEEEVLERLGACRRQHVVKASNEEEGWGLSGRLDGWCRNGVPVEVKVRMSPCFALRMCDYVQVQCYLHMLDGPPLMLLAQVWHRRPGQLRLTYVVRSRRFWRTVLRPALRRAAAVEEANKDHASRRSKQVQQDGCCGGLLASSTVMAMS